MCVTNGAYIHISSPNPILLEHRNAHVCFLNFGFGIFLYILSVLGMQLFSHKLGSPPAQDLHFDDPAHAFTSVFVLVTGEDSIGLMLSIGKHFNLKFKQHRTRHAKSVSIISVSRSVFCCAIISLWDCCAVPGPVQETIGHGTKYYRGVTELIAPLLLVSTGYTQLQNAAQRQLIIN